MLADLREIMKGKDAVSTEDIVAKLNALDEAPWGEIANGKPLNARGLAQRLRQFGISSKNIREGGRVSKGYAAEDMADAWSRYLPSPPKESATSATDDLPPSGHDVADDAATQSEESATADDVDLCPTCGANPVEMFGLDCEECMGVTT